MKPNLILATLLMLCFGSSVYAQTVNVKLVSDTTNKASMFKLPVPHRTADKAWWFWTAVSVGTAVGDVENTVYCEKDPHCQEYNPLYGHQPSRARLYAITAPTTAFSVYTSWRSKRKNDAAKAFGAKISASDHWYWYPVINTDWHGFGIGFTIANTGR